MCIRDSQCRELGVQAGFAVKPGTPIEPYLDSVSEFDQVMVMSVEPGFGGQKFMPEVLRKVMTLRDHIAAEGLDTIIGIDGGIGNATIAQAAEAGVDASLRGLGDGRVADPAVDANDGVQALRGNVVAQRHHLAQHLGHKLLPAKAGLHAHHHDLIKLRHRVEVRLDRGARLDGKASLDAELTALAVSYTHLTLPTSELV